MTTMQRWPRAAEVVYFELRRMADWVSGVCWPRQGTLASLSGYSERSIKRAIAWLVRRGVVEVVRRQAGNVYRLLTLASVPSEGPPLSPPTTKNAEKEPLARSLKKRSSSAPDAAAQVSLDVEPKPLVPCRGTTSAVGARLSEGATARSGNNGCYVKYATHGPGLDEEVRSMIRKAVGEHAIPVILARFWDIPRVLRNLRRLLPRIRGEKRLTLGLAIAAIRDDWAREDEAIDRARDEARKAAQERARLHREAERRDRDDARSREAQLLHAIADLTDADLEARAPALLATATAFERRHFASAERRRSRAWRLWVASRIAAEERS